VAGYTGRDPLTKAVTGPLPNVSAECWRVGFIHEAPGMQPPVVPVGEPWLNYAALPPKVMSNATINPGEP